MRRPVTHPSGVTIPLPPVQVLLEPPQTPISHGGFSLTPVATYSLEARVLRTKEYLGGPMSQIVPHDVVLGWGAMSDTAVLEKLEITQSNRFYFWSHKNPPPIPIREMQMQSSNHHLIASTPDIASGKSSVTVRRSLGDHRRRARARCC